MSKIVKQEDIIAFSAGSYIAEELEDLNITRKDFASVLDISVEELNSIIDNGADFNKKTAANLEKATGISKQSWLNIQNSYHKKVSLIKSNSKAGDKR